MRRKRLLALLLALGILGTGIVVLRSGDRAAPERKHGERAGIEAGVPGRPPAGSLRAHDEEERAPLPADAGPGDAPAGAPPAAPVPVGVVTGVVRLEGDEPYGEVTLRLRRVGADDPAETAGAPYPDGTFRFDGLGPGAWRVDASHPAYFPRAVGFTLQEGAGVGPLEIFLKRGGALRVRVRGVGALPLEDQRIELRSGGPVKVSGAPPLRAGSTDHEGQLLFEHLAPAQYEVQRRIEDRGEDGQMRMATVVPGEVVEVVFDTSCGLTGAVVGPEGEPLAEAYIRLIPVDFGSEGYRQEMATSDAEARFALHGIPAGEYRITVQVVSRERSFVASAGTVTLVEGQVLDHVVRVLPNFVSGRILRGDTGEPFRRDLRSGMSAQAQAYRVEVGPDGKAGKRLGDSATAYADDEGRYELVGLAPGHWWIWFPAPEPGYADGSLLLDLGAGGRRERVDVTLQPRKLATLRLRVLEPDGGPATGVDFSLGTDYGSRTLHGSLRNGEFVAQVPEGEQTVHAWRKGFHATVTATFPAGGTVRLEVMLEPDSAGDDGG